MYERWGKWERVSGMTTRARISFLLLPLHLDTNGSRFVMLCCSDSFSDFAEQCVDAKSTFGTTFEFQDKSIQFGLLKLCIPPTRVCHLLSRRVSGVSSLKLVGLSQ